MATCLFLQPLIFLLGSNLFVVAFLPIEFLLKDTLFLVSLEGLLGDFPGFQFNGFGGGHIGKLSANFAVLTNVTILQSEIV